MALYPPDDPFLFAFSLFGLPIAVRWYGVLIMSGALLAAMLASRRATARGIDPDHVWNQLMLGLVMGIAGARIYYVAFEWNRFADNPWQVLNLTTGGIAIHGALIGAVLSTVIYTRYAKLPWLEWLDICIPGFLLAQGIGRWGNFFNQEAYGRPTELPFGVVIDPNFRVPPYNDLVTYPLDTLFHATFLYESAWNLVGVGLLLLLDRRIGRGRPLAERLTQPGDLMFIYAIYYSIGRFWIEGLRIDSLCTSGIGGDCNDALRMAQVISIVLITTGAVLLFLNRRKPLARWSDQPADPASAA